MEFSGIQPGQVLHNTYRVERRIARGGMGIVYQASHARLVRKAFAIKVLSPAVMEDPSAYARFRREAEIVSDLGHRNIINIIDFNELPNGQPYIVMELLEGQDLKNILQERTYLDLALTAEVIEQTAAGLYVAHQKGVVHRDLKPGNIFLCDRGDGIEVKLLDFGISKIRNSNSVVTQDSMVIGTPNYMSPEQAEGEVHDIDHRTDIFSLGTIAYCCVSGRLPFSACSTPGTLFKVCYREPTPLTELVAGLPPAVQATVAMAMAKDRSFRYQQADMFAAAFRRAVSGDGRPPTQISLGPLPRIEGGSAAATTPAEAQRPTELTPGRLANIGSPGAADPPALQSTVKSPLPLGEDDIGGAGQPANGIGSATALAVGQPAVGHASVAYPPLSAETGGEPGGETLDVSISDIEEVSPAYAASGPSESGAPALTEPSGTIKRASGERDQHGAPVVAPSGPRKNLIRAVAGAAVLAFVIGLTIWGARTSGGDPDEAPLTAAGGAGDMDRSIGAAPVVVHTAPLVRAEAGAPTPDLGPNSARDSAKTGSVVRRRSRAVRRTGGRSARTRQPPTAGARSPDRGLGLAPKPTPAVKPAQTGGKDDDLFDDDEI